MRDENAAQIGIAPLHFVYDTIGFRNQFTETYMLMKNTEQLLAASVVLKEARALQSTALHEAKVRDHNFHEIIWNQNNPTDKFVEQAYRNLQAVAFKVTAVQGEDDAKARMNTAIRP